MLATFESGGISACRNGTPITLCPPSTSNSTICTWPSAKTSVCLAAGTPISPETVSAVSRSDETMRSKSSSRSCQMSRYSSFVVRTTVFVSGEIFFEKIAAMMLISSRDVHAMRRPAPATPASSRIRLLAPLPHEDAGVEALRERVQPLLVEVDDRDVVLAVERLDDCGADLAGSDDDDLHR